MENDNSRISTESASENSKSIYAELDQNQHSISRFFKLVSSGINKHGIKKITSILVNMDIDSDFETKGTSDLVDFICNEVISNYNKNREDKILRKDLFQKEKRGDITLARKMVIILLNQFVSISPTKLGNYFKRSRQVIHLAIDEFEKLNHNIKQDCDFLDRHDAISKKIIAYQEINKLEVKK